MRGDPTVTLLAHRSVKSQVRSCNHPAGPAPRTELQRIAGRNDLMSLDGDDGEVASGGGTNLFPRFFLVSITSKEILLF